MNFPDRAAPCIRLALSLSRAAVLAFAVSGGAVAAPIPFGPQQIVSTSDSGGIDVVSGDLDGDGDLDLVALAGTNSPSGAYWFENLDGAGTFAASRRIDDCNGQLCNPAGNQLTDMDADGDLDLLTGNFGIAAWYPNDGQGNFGARTVVRSEFVGFDDFAAADFDGDGDLDVVGLAAISVDKLAWFRNNGGGTFNPATETFIDSLVNGNGTGHVVPADMDGDGDSDLVATQGASGDNRVVWYRNTDGAGTFSAKLTISTAPQSLGDVAVTDVDGDGDLDVVSADYSFNATRWHENTAADGSAWADHLIDSTASASFFVKVADLDLDGDPDVLLATRVTNEARWIENAAGDGSSWTNRLITSGVSWPLATIAADLDGDGDPDIATASLFDNKFAWNENRTIHRNAEFDAGVNMDSGLPEVTVPRIVDLDRDGDPDVVAALRSNGRLVWFDNDGGSPAAWPLRDIATAIPAFTESSTVADLDGDGDPDVAISPGSGAVHWYQNDGGSPPSFTDRTLVSTLDPGLDVASGDIDGDGDIDLMALSYSALAWYENDGAALPGWTERSIPDSLTSARDLLLADLDRDGDLDAVTANNNAPTLVWYENDGGSPPGWTARSILSPSDPLTVEVADVDGDGAPDLVTASVAGASVLWFENGGGSPIVWTQRSVVTAVNALNAFPTDLDRDGDIDIVSSVFAPSQTWYESNGASPLQWTPRTFPGSFIRHWGGIDLKGEGDIDLIGCAPNVSRVDAFENLGGQYGFSGADISTGSAYDGELAPALAIGVQVNGRPGDSVGRLATLALRFDTPTGLLDAPLNSAQANALIDELRIYRDDGNGAFDDSQDILVATVGTLSLTAGVQTVTLPASDPNARVAAPATFFVAGLMTPTASQQPVNQFYVTHLAVAGSVVVDANAGLTLSGAAADNLSSNVLQARPRFVVNSFGDGVDASPGNGLCATGGGACTLRAAIMEANALAGANRIVLGAGTHTLTLAGTGENAAATGDLDITDTSGRLTLAGQGADRTIINGNGLDRVFHLLASVPMTLEDVTVTGGVTSGAGVRGAGLLSDSANSLTIRRCTFRGNTSGSSGAAIRTGSSSLVNIEDSTFHGNAGNDGGIVIDSGAFMNLTNCTVSGNTGVSSTSVAIETLGAMNVTSCTITGNQGGLRAASSSITIGNSTVAGNPSAGLTGDDVNTGTFTSAGYNRIGESASGAFVNGVNGNQVGTIGAPLTPQLQPLGDYGGRTLTHPPLSTSPAVDAGDCGFVFIDQRGVSRPIDVAGVTNVNNGCDIGSLELASGAALSRVEVPVRWCGLRGAPSIEDPSLLGASNVNDLLRRRHEVVTENIYDPQGGIVFRSAANFIVESFPLLADPDCVEGPPGTFTCARGGRGDVYIDPASAIFDEFEEVIAACRAAWQAQDPEIQGVTAVQIKRFIDKTGAPIEILGIGGRAEEGDAREQAAAGRVAVVDHFYRQDVPGNPSPPNPSDTIDRLLGHEMGHALSLRHGDGLDNDGNSVIDDNDEASVGLPRFDGDNLMQYRSGTTLSVGQVAQARNHLAATVPDVVVQPLVDSVTDGTPIDSKNARVLEFGFDGVLDLANARVLEFRNANVLEFESESVLDFANARVLEFKNANVLEFKNARVLEFGMGYSGEQPTDSTTLHATTAALPWPPALRPKTRYYFYLDVDRDDATGAYPAGKPNPSDPPHNFPGSSNFVSSPNVTVEVGVDLIAQVELDASCPGDDCTSTASVKVFDYNDGTGQYVQVLSDPTPSITAVGVGLYVDNGGAPVDLESAPSGITVQPEIPNSILFNAGWGFTTPGGGGPPVPDRVRMEVVTTIECAGDILNDDPSSGTRNCQCTSCAQCPDYPGCTGSAGTPQTLADATILADNKSGELAFQPPVLPACVVIPALAQEGQAVTVHVIDLPTDLSGTVVIERDDAVIGSTPTASIDAAGSVSVTATLPAGALGDVTLKAGIAGYALRAPCQVTVTPTLACPDNDADGTCNAADADDDNDGVADGSDSAPLNPFVCRDLDADTCNDCSSGVAASANDGPDYDLDGSCDRGDPDDDNDSVLDGADGERFNANACGDLDGDQCDDCILTASPSPSNDGTDSDADGLCDFGDPDDDNDGGFDWLDCAPSDGTLIASPAEVSNVRAGSGGLKNRISWTAPQAQGGSATVSDLVRGSLTGLPVGSGAETCLATTGAAQFDHLVLPAASQGFWYVVRGRNGCGTGTYGYASGGSERISAACP